MKKKDIFIIIIFSYLLIQIITYKELVFIQVKEGINIWKNDLLPSLLPFIIISDILINYDVSNYLEKILNPLFNKLFKINSNSSVILILSMLSGFPSNSKYTKEMYEKNNITKKEAEKILTFTHFSNPLFILGTLSTFFLKNKTLGIIILISHYLGNFIIGLIFRNYYHSKPLTIKNTYQKKDFIKIFINSLKKTTDTVFLILGTLISFLIISSLITTKLKLNPYNEMIIKGLLEITSGLKLLATLNIKDIYKTIIATFFLSFGGLCILMQVISNIADTNISYKPYLIARIIHATISSIIAFILFLLYFSLF